MKWLLKPIIIYMLYCERERRKFVEKSGADHDWYDKSLRQTYNPFAWWWKYR